MASYKLALIGKNLTHSLSPDLYKKVLGDDLKDYELFDIDKISELPPLKELLDEFHGVSVTSPYKYDLFKMCDSLSAIAQHCKAVNAVRLFNDKVEGILSDADAIKTILSTSLKDYLDMPISILGDGAMSRLISLLLDEKQIPYRVFSRKRGWSGVCDTPSLVINTCLREAQFSFSPMKESVIWDLNYNYTSSLNCDGVKYTDGLEMLELQARYALIFWNVV